MLPLEPEVPIAGNGKPDSCKVCTLYDSTEGVVWGNGPLDAQLMGVGEAPGEEEGQALLPFVGGSGRVLTALCVHAGIDRTKVFLTNAVKCRPTVRNAEGKLVNRQPTDHEIRCCAPLLAKEIDTVRPNAIAALGNIPMKVLTGATKGILKTRSVPTAGSLRKDEKAERYKVIGILHPAYIMRQQDLWPAAVFDLVRAKQESAFPDIRRRQWTNVIHANLSNVKERLLSQIRESGWYAHDLETTGLDPKRDVIRCIGIAGNDREVYVFDMTEDVYEFVKMLHADPTLMCVGQNSEGFDIWFQEGKKIYFAWDKGKRSFDTLLGFHQLNPSMPKDLAFIGASVTDELHWKDDSMYKAGEDALQLGCGKDVYATARGVIDQLQEMRQIPGQESLYFDHIMPLQPVLRNMSRRGLRKDMRTAVGWAHVLLRKANEYEARLRTALGEPLLDINSPKQLMDLLYRRMGLPVQYNRNAQGEFRPTVDADALDVLAQHTKNPIFTLVRSIRTLRKWESTFISCPHDENFFVHGRFSSAKAANGRMNSYDPNMQNFPVDCRVILVPDSSDEVLIARDWGQIEWRIAMALSGDRVGLAALAEGRDAHKDAYSQAFGKLYDEVTKGERDIAKAVNYGLLYGRGSKSVAAGRPGHPEDILPLPVVEDYVGKFLAKFEGYGKYRRMLEQQVRRQHYVASAWGRRRYWYTMNNMPEAYNHPISSTAASMMYEALVELEEQLPAGATLRLTVHDEIVVNAPKSQKILQQTIDCMKEIMEQPFRQITEASLYPDVVRHFYPNGWSCPSDSNIGETWRATKGKFKQDIAAEAVLKKHLGVTIA